MKKLLKRLILLLILALFCAGAYFTAAGYVMYKKATQSVSVTEKMKAVRLSDSYTTLDQIPDIYEQAVVSVEDRRFYEHRGVDVIALGRALLKNLQAMEFSQGGSTITQQLAKNLFFSGDKKIERKAAELFVVYQLEKNYSKDVILEAYINTVYYGDGYYCIKDAAEGYFGAAPAEMTDYECTMLAGVPNAPSVYAPTKNNDLAQKRQAYVLNRMVKCRVITEKQKNQILAEAD